MHRREEIPHCPPGLLSGSPVATERRGPVAAVWNEKPRRTQVVSFCQVARWRPVVPGPGDWGTWASVTSLVGAGTGALPPRV